MSNQSINLRHLRAFYEVGIVGQISQVSKRVFMSQPAISQALAKLENRYGAAFFYRRSKTFVLTEAGQLMHVRAGRLLSILDRGAHEIMQGKAAGTRLGRQMTFTQLRALVAIADQREFTLGAQSVGTSQPAISRAIRELENICGRMLIEKTGRGVVLTRAAESLAQSARLAFHEVQQGEDEVRALQGKDTSVLTIGSLPLARSAILPDAILNFAAKNPNIDIHVIDGPYDDMLTGLRHGEIDVLIGALRSPAPANDVTEEALFVDRLSVIARADHPLATQENLTAKDLQAFPWIVPRAGTPTRQYFDNLVFEDWGGEKPRLVESSSLILVRRLLVRSDGLTIMSDNQVTLDVEKGILASLAFNFTGSERAIGLTIRKNWKPTKTQSQFLDELRSPGLLIS